MMNIWRGLAALLVLTSVVGCGTGAENGSQPRAQSYPRDGYMGTTFSNPNHPLNPSYHHYEDDTRLMDAVLAQIPGIADSHFAINGDRVNVRLRLVDSLTQEQIEEIRSTAQMALDTNMPRYHVFVSVR